MTRDRAFVPASIEMTPGQVVKVDPISSGVPSGTRIYLTDLGTDPDETLVAAARRLGALGYRVVPHLAVRRLPSRGALENRLTALAHGAGIDDLLVIGGGIDRPAGPFAGSMDVLETGLIDRLGIGHIGIAGHPEGSPDMTDETIAEALRLKHAFRDRTDARLRIVTQFGFDGAAFVRWADGIAAEGIDLPVHLGVAGPANIVTLMRYAAMCGVGNSVGMLKKKSRGLGTLASGFSPEEAVGPIEAHWRQSETTNIRQLHVFPFGGLQKSSDWLHNRGSWREAEAQQATCGGGRGR